MASLVLNPREVQPPVSRPVPVREPYDFFFTANEANLKASARAAWLVIRDGESITVAALARRAGVKRRQCFRLRAELVRQGFLKIDSEGRCRRTIPPAVSPMTPPRKSEVGGIQKRTHDEWTRLLGRYLDQADQSAPSWSFYVSFKKPRSDAESLACVKGFLRYVRLQNEDRRIRCVAVPDRTGQNGESTRLHYHLLILGADHVSARWWSHGRAESHGCGVIRPAGREWEGRLRYCADKLVAGEALPLLA